MTGRSGSSPGSSTSTAATPWYARSRAGSDDFSRMRRQRCVAGALMEQADPAGLLARYPQLARVVKDNVSIDIPRPSWAWVDLALRIQEGDSIRSLPLTSKVVTPGHRRSAPWCGGRSRPRGPTPSRRVSGEGPPRPSRRPGHSPCVAQPHGDAGAAAVDLSAT